MKFLLFSFLFIQVLFSQELTRKIMVSSFNSQNDANYALQVFYEKRNEEFIKLQKEMDFEVLARPSGSLFVIAIEAFKNYKEAKKVLNQISSEHPDAYINKYTARVKNSVTISDLTDSIKEDKKQEKIAETTEDIKQEIKKETKVIDELFVDKEMKSDEVEVKEEITEISKEEIKDNIIEIKDQEEPVKEKSIDTNKYSFILHSRENIQEQVKRNLSVFPLIKDSSIIKVEYKDSTAQRTSDFVNQLLNEYIEQNLNENSKQLKESLLFIEEQLEIAKDELSTAEKELELFRSQNLLFNTDDKVSQINKQKDELQKELLTVERRNKIFNSVKDSLLKGELISSTSFADKSLNDLIKQLNTERSLEQELSTKYTPSHKTMIALSEKIEGLESAIIKNVKNIDISLNESTKSLKYQIRELNEEIIILPKLAMELSKLERRFNLKESVYKDLLSKYNDTSSKYISSKRVNRVIDYAQEPEFAIKPRKTIIVVMGLMVALLAAFLFILIKEYFDVYIKKPSDLLSLTSLPYYGYIPFVKSKNYNKLFILDDLNSEESESFRRIRSSLELTAKKDNSRIILTTSRVSNEGKSTFIANLAAAIALSGKKTILLGLDLRIPQLHLKFDVPNDNGISELLANNITLEQAVKTVPLSNNNSLDVIISGATPPNPAELIGNGTIDTVLAKLRTKYDYILIDSTPTALVPDTLPLLSKADTILFVLKSEYSKKEFISKTEELIEKYNLKNVGYVLTSVKRKYYQKVKYDKNYSLYATKSK